MMISSFRSDSSELPCVVALSSALAGGEITPREYNGALRVAEAARSPMEDSIKMPFCKTTWSEVEAGDTALMPWKSLDRIVEVLVELVEPWQGLGGKPLVRAKYLFAGTRYSRVFDPDETVYVQSRF